MSEIWQEFYDIILIILGSVLFGVLIGLWWGHHTVQAPFRERRVEKRTLIQRIRWTFRRKLKPIIQHS